MSRQVFRYSRPFGLGAETTRLAWGGHGLRANRGRGVPGGWIDGGKPPPTPNREEVFHPSRSDAWRIAAKSAWGLRRSSLFNGGGRGAIGRSMIGRKAYNASIAPISREAHTSAPRGGREVVNSIGGALQLPPALEDPRYDRSEHGAGRIAGSPSAKGSRAHSRCAK